MSKCLPATLGSVMVVCMHISCCFKNMGTAFAGLSWVATSKAEHAHMSVLMSQSSGLDGGGCSLLHQIAMCLPATSAVVVSLNGAVANLHWDVGSIILQCILKDCSCT